ncbi:MAG: hypothetical protein ACTSWN_08825 [Promethearchaeota archaeon]
MARFHPGRLLVFLFGVGVIPAYFIVFFILYWNRFFSIPLEPWQWIFVIFINPIVYIISWFFFLVLFGTKIGNTYDMMKKVVSPISVRYNIYYGVSALFFLIGILLPLITPVLAMLMFGSIIWRITTIKRDWAVNENTPTYVIVLVLIAMVVPILCNVYFYIKFIPMAIEFWNKIFIGLFLPYLKIIARAMGTALTLGGLIYLARYGTSEYEVIFQETGERPREFWNVLLLQVFSFIFFLILIFMTEGLEVDVVVTQATIFDIIAYITIAINVILIFGNWIKSKQFKTANKSILSYLLIIAFYIFNLLNGLPFFAFMETLTLIASSFFYIGIFVLTLIIAEDK